MMDRSSAIDTIMALLNEGGLMTPGSKAHEIVSAYIAFKIDRLGPEKALEDVQLTKDHMLAQIHQMAMPSWR